MYIAELRIENFRCFGEGEHGLTLPLNPGLTAIIGENDSGKTAIIDALRFVLGTSDQEYNRVEESDFHSPDRDAGRCSTIRIQCRFDGLGESDQATFAEHLTYIDADGKVNPVLYLNWTAREVAGSGTGRRFVYVECKSGRAGDGPILEAQTRALLCATYLRPLRDAERAMSAGKGSRLSQILLRTHEVRESGVDFDVENDPRPNPDDLSVLGVGDYANSLLGERTGIRQARQRLNQDYLKPLSFAGDDLSGHIGVTLAGNKDARLRQLLEKLVLELRQEGLNAPAYSGLGSNNLLFIACELLLLGSEATVFPLLLVEEPEAHLHPQRQLRLIQFLQRQADGERADGQRIQIILTTHSPNLASTVKLDNLVLLSAGRAFPLRAGRTKLEPTDYKFLERYLDVTKANLFFARGVLIVEGDSENILLPTIARLIGRDFTEHGVSVVNVGHTGLRRFARIFQRSDPEMDGIIAVPVACIADADVMPDCAPEIVGKVKAGEEWPDAGRRRWRAQRDFVDGDLAAHRKSIRERASGQMVETFVSDVWTLEYDLAHAGLAEDVWVSAMLAQNDGSILSGAKHKAEVEAEAEESFRQLLLQGLEPDELAARIYAQFTTGARVSKSLAAQNLAERLENRYGSAASKNELRERLPGYLVAAIEHVTPLGELVEKAPS